MKKEYGYSTQPTFVFENRVESTVGSTYVLILPACIRYTHNEPFGEENERSGDGSGAGISVEQKVFTLFAMRWTSLLLIHVEKEMADSSRTPFNHGWMFCLPYNLTV